MTAEEIQEKRSQNAAQGWLIIRKIVLPLLAMIAVVGFVTDGWVSSKIVNAPLSNAYKVGKLIDPESHPNEIAIFGPSIARNAYYCDSLGANYYNYSMENAGVVINELMLRLETSKREKTAPVIMDFHFRFLEVDTTGASVNLRTYLPFTNDSRVREFLREHGRSRPHQSLKGARYFGVYSSYAKDYLAEVFQPRKLYHRGGVFNKKAPAQAAFDKKIEARRNAGPQPYSWTETPQSRRRGDLLGSQEYVNRLDSIIAANPQRLFILMGSPRHYTVLEALEPTGGYDDMKNYGREMLKKHSNVRVVIFEADYPDSYFKDTGHLSLEGARIFSGQMRRAMEANSLYFTGEGDGKPDEVPSQDDILIVQLEAAK